MSLYYSLHSSFVSSRFLSFVNPFISLPSAVCCRLFALLPRRLRGKIDRRTGEERETRAHIAQSASGRRSWEYARENYYCDRRDRRVSVLSLSLTTSFFIYIFIIYRCICLLVFLNIYIRELFQGFIYKLKCYFYSILIINDNFFLSISLLVIIIDALLFTPRGLSVYFWCIWREVHSDGHWRALYWCSAV